MFAKTVLARGAFEIKGWGTHEFFSHLFGVDHKDPGKIIIYPHRTIF